MTTSRATTLRVIFAGDRGRLLVGLLFAEFGTAVQTVAEAAVLPLASKELHGAAYYGPTVAAPTLTAIVFIVLGPALTARLGPARALLASTVVYVAGVLLAVLAPTMAFVLIGRLVQGAAIGLLAGFGLSAIGTLYEDALRPRVIGLFSLSWLLPSLLGPVLNAAVAGVAGWRGAMAWPALVVLAARIVIGRRAAMLPDPDAPARVPAGSAVLVLGGLILATIAPGLPAPLHLGVWAAGLVTAFAGGVLLLRRLLGGTGVGLLLIGVVAGLNIGFFGGEGLLSLGVIAVTGGGVLGASIAYTAGAASWSILGLRPSGERLRRYTGAIGSTAIAIAAALLATVTLSAASGAAALGVVVGAWAVAGLGMGLAYPVFAARPFDGVESGRVPTVSAAVAFAQTAGVAVAGLLGSGFYSVTAQTLPASAGVGIGYLLIAAATVATLSCAVILLLRPRPSASGVAPLPA
ncbi:MFS transporter [uncultured Amnibacterium sp.]|uniref:MFS transporter n=1 Tax=uncultured Amnibacterium sp. TaxID=1631851 RepID=UPI0035CBCA62